MIVSPAVDLRGGACVQLIGGDYDRESVRVADPMLVAERWERAGFRRLHIVDLDAATGRGSNRRAVREILGATSARCSVGGGVRTLDDIEGLLVDGATNVIIGSRALESPAWLAGAAAAFPAKLVVAADVIERILVTRGWTQQVEATLAETFARLNELPLAEVLVTAVHREGQLAGTDVALFEEIVRISTAPIIASGGIANIEQLRELATTGVAGVVVGMALYTGDLDPETTAKEFGK